MEENPILLSKQQASMALGVCLRTVDSLISDKKLPVVRIGRRVLIHRQVLERFAKHDHPTRERKVS